MLRLSEGRRQVAALGGSMAAISGSGTALTNGHPSLRWALLGMVLMLLSVMLAKMLRLRRDGCE
jgi:hypothetical protein